MSLIEIKKVETKKELKTFIDFHYDLYEGNEYDVPNLFSDDMNTLSKDRNAAFDFCEAEYYLAYKDGKVAGRVAAIINDLANKQWNHKEVRFGWYDFIDDKEVSGALMEKVEEFGRENGMDAVVGPLGFTDFDPEGLLVEGYDRLSTMVLIYNYPYYVTHIEEMGFTKDADWIEYKIDIPKKLPEKMERVAAVIKERTNVHLRQLTKKIIREEDYAHKIFKVINECYKDLYNFTVLPTSMADKYIGFYLSILDLNYVSIVENENNEIVAFGITMPSIARALQKSRGKLFPFGWWYLLKSLFFKREEGVEMLLVGVRPDYQNSGVNSLVFLDMFKKYSDAKVKWAETNAILEDNLKNQRQFADFDKECKKRRRSYIKHL